MANATDPVDVVITWVDTRDPDWRASFNAFAENPQALSHGDEKNREWDTLRYVLRGLELYCPWVRTIHFVTAGQLPEWLDVSHPKLNVVDHRDFMPADSLPTFNSRALELNLHRIPDLAENFVYFNDDMLVLSPVGPEHFFPHGRPAAMAILNALQHGDSLSHAMLNNLEVINKHFDKRKVMASHRSQWFSRLYGSKLVRNLLLLPWPEFTGFYEPHLPMAMTKSAYASLWAAEPEVLSSTTFSKFRDFRNVNPFLIRYWQICTGHFSAVSPTAYGRFYEFGRDDIMDIVTAIKDGTHALLCVNDGVNTEYETQRPLLAAAMASALPRASGFEA